MKRTSLAVFLLLPLLAACSPPVASTWEAPQPGARDEAVAALLPQGTFTVSGGFYLRDVLSTAIEGYVDFGVSPDGTDCTSDYTLTDAREQTDGFVPSYSAVRTVRSAFGPTWSRDVTDAGSGDEVTELSISGDSPWFDGPDPSKPGLALLFAPELITGDFGAGVSEGAGTGSLCSIPVMPRIMSVEGERLVFDADRVIAADTANKARWVQMFVDAAGLEGSERNEALEFALEQMESSWPQLTAGCSITITERADGVVELIQSWEGRDGFVRLSFVPTQPREVVPVVAKTYFQKVSDEIEAAGLPPREFVRDAFGV